MPRRRRDARRTERTRSYAAGWGAPAPDENQPRIDAIVSIGSDPDAVIDDAIMIVTSGVWKDKPAEQWPLSLRCIEIDGAAARLLRKALRRNAPHPDAEGRPSGATTKPRGPSRKATRGKTTRDGRSAGQHQDTHTPRGETGRLTITDDGVLQIW